MITEFEEKVGNKSSFFGAFAKLKGKGFLLASFPGPTPGLCPG